MLPGRVNSGIYEDRYSASVAGAEAVLASTYSFGAGNRPSETPELRTVSAASVEPTNTAAETSSPARRALQVCPTAVPICN